VVHFTCDVIEHMMFRTVGLCLSGIKLLDLNTRKLVVIVLILFNDAV